MARRPSLCAAALVALLLAGAPPAGAVERRLLVNGDSLAVGTQPYLGPALRGWRVLHSVAISWHAYQGPGVLRAYGRRLPRLIHLSLGTNDDPRHVSGFRSAIHGVMRSAGRRRCVVWANVVRPPVAGASYRGYNRVLGHEARRRRNLRVVDWARLVREHPWWLAGDGVHVSAEGYRARARVVARAVRRCRRSLG